jgi:hypothetical protein
LQKDIAKFGYHQQFAWYIDAARALGLADDDTAFVFVAQEKTPPYLVSVVQLDEMALRIGRFLNGEALRLYAQCRKTGRWPGYADDVQIVQLPGWYERQFDNEDIW